MFGMFKKQERETQPLPTYTDVYDTMLYQIWGGHSRQRPALPTISGGRGQASDRFARRNRPYRAAVAAVRMRAAVATLQPVVKALPVPVPVAKLLA